MSDKKFSIANYYKDFDSIKLQNQGSFLQLEKKIKKAFLDKCNNKLKVFDSVECNEFIYKIGEFYIRYKQMRLSDNYQFCCLDPDYNASKIMMKLKIKIVLLDPEIKLSSWESIKNIIEDKSIELCNKFENDPDQVSSLMLKDMKKLLYPDTDLGEEVNEIFK